MAHRHAYLHGFGSGPLSRKGVALAAAFFKLGLPFHGLHDEVVPVESSRRYAGLHDHVTLAEVNDDHALAGSIDLVIAEVLAFFDLG